MHEAKKCGAIGLRTQVIEPRAEALPRGAINTEISAWI